MDTKPLCYLGSKHSGRVDDAAGPNHEAEVALLQVSVSSVENVTVESFAEPDNVRAEQASAAFLVTLGELGDRDPSGVGLRVGGTAVLERLADGGVSVDADVAALSALGLEEIPMQLNDVGGSRPLVEAINVLGDHSNLAALASESVLDLGNGGVGGVRAL